MFHHHIQDRLIRFLEHDFSASPRIIRSGAGAFKVFYAVARDLADGNLSLRAMSLVYTTLITLVPLLAISFSVLKGFGVHNQIEPWLLGYLAPLGEKAHDITTNIIAFVDNIKVGVLGALGVFLLIYSVIALMQKIERAFNFIWRVSKSRTLARRFSDYLSVLLFGPFLIFLSAGLTATARSTDFLAHFTSVPGVESTLSFLSVFVPYVILAAGFSFFYVYMPNTRVKAGPALAGGLFAALLWKVMGWIFTNVIAASATYVAVYAAFATLIVFMVWVYLSWLVILMGANISFYIQHPKYVRVARRDIVLSSRMRLDLGLSIVEALTHAQYDDQKGLDADTLSGRFHVPVIAVQHMMEALERGNVLAQGASDKQSLYYPARPLDQITVGEVLEAINSASEQDGMTHERLIVAPQTQDLLKALRVSMKEHTDKTVKAVFGPAQ